MRLKKLRKKVLELSQEEFGKAIGLSKSNISNIELGPGDFDRQEYLLYLQDFRHQ